MKNFILDKELAKQNSVKVLGIADEIIIFTGNDIPHFVTWDEELQNIREAKLSELVERKEYLIPEGFKLVGEKIIEMTIYEKKINGLIPLEENEIIKNGEIKILTNYEMVINNKKQLVPGEYLNHETKEVLRKEYPKDGKVYKWENNEWVLNVEETEILKKEIRNKIIKLEMEKPIYINKGWNTNSLLIEISELTNELSKLN